ncbi:Lsr2 family protein [Streptomyces sp. 891-h]|nr:Lsr2 family protein [Streptomyces sp. 891-h]
MAALLRERYGTNVEQSESDEPQSRAAGLERADQERPPEAAVEPKPQKPEKPAAKVDAKAVRAWAAEQGLEVPARGKLPDSVVEAYQVAHGGE